MLYIIIIAVTGGVLLIVVVIIICCCCCRRNSKSEAKHMTPVIYPPPATPARPAYETMGATTQKLDPNNYLILHGTPGGRAGSFTEPNAYAEIDDINLDRQSKKKSKKSSQKKDRHADSSLPENSYVYAQQVDLGRVESSGGHINLGRLDSSGGHIPLDTRLSGGYSISPAGVYLSPRS